VCVCVREAHCQHCSVTFSSVSSAVGSVCAASFSVRLNYFAEGSTKLTRASPEVNWGCCYHSVSLIIASADFINPFLKLPPRKLVVRIYIYIFSSYIYIHIFGTFTDKFFSFRSSHTSREIILSHLFFVILVEVDYFGACREPRGNGRQRQVF
jgi:hypothetical protein